MICNLTNLYTDYANDEDIQEEQKVNSEAILTSHLYPEPDIGQSSHPWNIYMQNIPSSKPYINCVKEFAYWQHDKVENMNILITNYFQYRHSVTLTDGKNQYAPISLKSKYSINQFWKMTGRGDLSLHVLSSKKTSKFGQKDI